MKLPNADQAIVLEEKVVSYLLNSRHPEGAGKAKFFLALGFHTGEWQVFAQAISRLATYNELSHQSQSVHGWKDVVDGEIQSPIGRSVLIRTVWIVDHGKVAPRLVTSYPLVREEDDDQGT
jgi:hypothetical protein